MEKGDWYSNKDLYEMIQELKGEIHTAIVYMKEYNGLRQVINESLKKTNEIEDRVIMIEQCKKTKKETTIGMREWVLFLLSISGWVIALINMLK